MWLWIGVDGCDLLPYVDGLWIGVIFHRMWIGVDNGGLWWVWG